LIFLAAIEQTSDVCCTQVDLQDEQDVSGLNA
jgi:hypothetical protein